MGLIEGFSVITLHSPANIRVTDSLGRSTGYNELTNSVIQEIPNSLYSGPNSEPQTILLPSPSDNKYNVTVMGTGNGAYSVDFEVINSHGTQIKTATGNVIPNAVYDYSVSYTDQSITVSVNSANPSPTPSPSPSPSPSPTTQPTNPTTEEPTPSPTVSPTQAPTSTPTQTTSASPTTQTTDTTPTPKPTETLSPTPTPTVPEISTITIIALLFAMLPLLILGKSKKTRPHTNTHFV